MQLICSKLKVLSHRIKPLLHCARILQIKGVWLKFQFWNKKGSSEKFLWAPCLWVGRWWEAILSYISIIDVNKIIHDAKSLILIFDYKKVSKKKLMNNFYKY